MSTGLKLETVEPLVGPDVNTLPCVKFGEGTLANVVREIYTVFFRRNQILCR